MSSSNNYAVINGRRIKLTDEQVANLMPTEWQSTPFMTDDTYDSSYSYYTITGTGEVSESSLLKTYSISKANAFTDQKFAEQVSLHQLLYRKLLQYAYEHNEEYEKTDNTYYYIVSDSVEISIASCMNNGLQPISPHVVLFPTSEIAKLAIGEIVEPFMSEYPGFIWDISPRR